jgi:hypothetical protein
VGKPSEKGVDYCRFANPCLTRDQDDLTGAGMGLGIQMIELIEFGLAANQIRRVEGAGRHCRTDRLGIVRGDWRNKAIASAGQGGNELWGSGGISKNFTQFTDASGEHTIGNSGIRPNGVQQGFFGHQLIRVFNQIHQELKRLGSHSQTLVTPR